MSHQTTERAVSIKSYDRLNRLSKISSAPSASSAVSFEYSYNPANQRTRATLADGSYWLYEYDRLGQVISGKKYWSDGTPVAGQQFGYGFDDIGNRTGTKAGGDENGLNLRTATYGANLLNQYTNRTVPGAVDIMGVSFATNTVTVNGQTAYRKGEYFRKELPVANSTALSTNITVAATGQSSVTGSMLVAKASEAFWHDADGNLLSDSLWTNRWNAENRLVHVESTTAIPANKRMREAWSHLPDGRWIERIVSTNNGSAYYPAFTNRFIWDGQVLMAILNHTNGLVMSFVRGLDLSGSIQGAGGVGGVLAVNFAPSTLIPQPSTHFLSYDGNGNVVALTGTNGANSGQLEYGPFSEPIRVTGIAAQAMPLRFSTMYEDSVTGDRKYLFRDLNPSTGRWKSRDPIAEKGGVGLYTISRNNAINAIDVLGLYIELWYGNHPVKLGVNTGHHHSKLWLVTDEHGLASTTRYQFQRALSKTMPMPRDFIGPACIWFVSIGAGPVREELVADFNRGNDVGFILGNPTLVTSFDNTQSALQFLDHVGVLNSRMNANFQNTTLEYEGLPGWSYTAWDQWDEFNSNSYISGLLIALKFTTPLPGRGVLEFGPSLDKCLRHYFFLVCYLVI